MFYGSMVLGRRFSWRGVVVDVGFLGVITILIVLRIVVTVRDLVVIVGMRVPIRTVFEVVSNAVLVVMTYMPVVVAMSHCLVGMRRRFSFAFRALNDFRHRPTLPTVTSG
jgi:hypothetical protein